MKYRQYVNGKLNKTSKHESLETMRVYLNNIQRDWSRNLDYMPTAAPAEGDEWYGSNTGWKVTRISDDELIVITTEGRELRWVIVK